MKDQFAKFGRIEYVAVAYNAGPGRVGQWRASLPAEIDEFVEAIPFKETKGYVQGVIRNTAQYRRLYDDNGNFRPNVGSKPLRSASRCGSTSGSTRTSVPSTLRSTAPRRPEVLSVRARPSAHANEPRAMPGARARLVHRLWPAGLT